MTEDDQRIIQAMLDAAVQSIHTAIGNAEERSQEFARGIETRLLGAFHDYARGQIAAVHRLQTSDADLAERISALESRVLNLETRPPQ